MLQATFGFSDTGLFDLLTDETRNTIVLLCDGRRRTTNDAT